MIGGEFTVAKIIRFTRSRNCGGLHRCPVPGMNTPFHLTEPQCNSDLLHRISLRALTPTWHFYTVKRSVTAVNLPSNMPRSSYRIFFIESRIRSWYTNKSKAQLHRYQHKYQSHDGLQDVFDGMLYKTLKQAGYFADDDYS
jgi:hypothetical protein